MATVTVTLRHRLMTVEIAGADVEYVTQLAEKLSRIDGPVLETAQPPDSAVQRILRGIEEPSGLKFNEVLPAAMDTPEPPVGDFLPATPPTGPARRAPRVENDPEIRDRQRQAAANAREALAAKRAAEKAERDADATAAQTTDTEPIEAAESAGPPAQVKPRRGRPPKAASAVSTQDLSGDREDGDTQHGPNSEPADPHAQAQAQTQAQAKTNGASAPAAVLSEVEKRQICFNAMTNVAKVSSSALDEVKKTVGKYGVTKIKDVALDRMDEFWADTETLCGTFNVTFPP